MNNNLSTSVKVTFTSFQMVNEQFSTLSTPEHFTYSNSFAPWQFSFLNDLDHNKHFLFIDHNKHCLFCTRHNAAQTIKIAQNRNTSLPRPKLL